jgi:nitroreductase
MNRQSPIIVCVQDPAARETLRRMNAAVMGSDGDPFYGAPTVLVVLADKAIRTCVEDASLVIGNLMNAAFSVGVDSCWIHRAKGEFESDEGKALHASWGIDGDYVGVGHLILGYRDGELPVTRPRKETYIYRV